MNDKPPLDSETPSHICAISAGMVGVCLTTISLIRVVITINKIDTLADDILSLDAIIFLFATLTSYCALRTQSLRRLHKMERLADIAFIAGICLMVVACFFITYFIRA